MEFTKPSPVRHTTCVCNRQQDLSFRIQAGIDAAKSSAHTHPPCRFPGTKSATTRSGFPANGRASKARAPRNKPSGTNFSRSSASNAASSPALKRRSGKSPAIPGALTCSGPVCCWSSTNPLAKTCAKPRPRLFNISAIWPMTRPAVTKSPATSSFPTLRGLPCTTWSRKNSATCRYLIRARRHP